MLRLLLTIIEHIFQWVTLQNMSSRIKEFMDARKMYFTQTRNVIYLFHRQNYREYENIAKSHHKQYTFYFNNLNQFEIEYEIMHLLKLMKSKCYTSADFICIREHIENHLHCVCLILFAVLLYNQLYLLKHFFTNGNVYDCWSFYLSIIPKGSLTL